MRKIRIALGRLALLGMAVWGGFWLYDTVFGSSLLRSPDRVSGRYIGADGATRDKVIVFVHGVTGDEEATWTYKDKQSGNAAYWPQLMRADETYRDYDIYVVNYPTTYREEAPTMVDLARGLNKRLTDAEILPRQEAAAGARKVKEIVFLGHSMGNLIVRTAMMIDARYNGDAVHVPLLLSLASPSKGSSIAQLAVPWTRNPQYKAMVDVKDNPFLDILNTLWLQNPPRETEIACAAERQAMPGMTTLVVDHDSATAICTRPKPARFAADHESIAKPRGRDSDVYQWATQEIKKENRPTAAVEPARWTERTVVIGGKDFLESNTLAAIMAFTINPRFREPCPKGPNAPAAKPACFNVELRYHIGGRDRTFKALEDEEIDLYAEYTGTLLMNFPDIRYSISREEAQSEAAHTSASLDARFKSKKNLRRFEVLDRFALDSAYRMVLRKAKADELKLAPNKHGRVLMSELVQRAIDDSVPLRFSSTPDFFYRPDGVAGLRERYALERDQRMVPFDFTAIRFAQHDHKYDELKAGVTDVADAYLTDPELLPGKQSFFVELEDDREFFTHYYALPLVNRQLLKKYDPLRTSLARLNGKVTTSEIAELIGEIKKAGIKSEDLKLAPKNTAGAHTKRDAFEALVKAFMIKWKLLDAGA